MKVGEDRKQGDERGEWKNQGHEMKEMRRGDKERLGTRGGNK